MLFRSLAHEVVIATDDPRIMAACGKFQANCQMTLKSHPSGTDRVAEVATKVPGDIFVNLQGDEPMIDPASIDLLIRQLLENSDSPMATLATPIRSREDWLNPNCVKVVHDGSHRALYFSRSPIPFQRDGEPDFDARPASFLQHIGMYAYGREFLLGISKFPRILWKSWKSWNNCGFSALASPFNWELSRNEAWEWTHHRTIRTSFPNTTPCVPGRLPRFF